MENNTNKEAEIIIKKDFHRTNIQRLLHTLCLIMPIVFAFAGYYISTPLFKLLTKKTAAPEIFKFLCTAVLFLLSTLVVLIITRRAKPVIKISLSDAPKQAD